MSDTLILSMLSVNFSSEIERILYFMFALVSILLEIYAIAYAGS